MPVDSPAKSSPLADPEWRRDRARKAGKSRTTPDYHLSRIREIVAATREAQGLPPVIEDELTLSRIAEILKSTSEVAA